MRRSATGSVLLPGIETSVTSNVVAPEYRLTLSPKIESDSGATAWAARMRCAYSSYASTPLYWANAKHGNSSAHAASQLATSLVLPPPNAPIGGPLRSPSPENERRTLSYLL